MDVQNPGMREVEFARSDCFIRSTGFTMCKSNLRQGESHRDVEQCLARGLEPVHDKVEPGCTDLDIDLFEEFTEFEIAMMLIEALTIG